MIRTAVAQDAVALADKLRQQDQVEVTLRYGRARSIQNLLAESILISPGALAFEDGGQVLALAGCAYYGGTGVPWFVCSDQFVKKHKRLFLSVAPGLVQEYLAKYKQLQNFIHAENFVSMRWLRFLGFTIDTVPGETFYRFHLKGS